jgi:hypothetical protein
LVVCIRKMSKKLTKLNMLIFLNKHAKLVKLLIFCLLKFSLSILICKISTLSKSKNPSIY